MTIQENRAASGVVGEFVTEARLDALNAALAAHGVDASWIITIFEVPASGGRQRACRPRYHVLYRRS